MTTATTAASDEAATSMTETIVDRDRITLIYCDYRGKTVEDPLSRAGNDVAYLDPRTNRHMRLAGVRVEVDRTATDEQRSQVVGVVARMRLESAAHSTDEYVDQILAALGLAPPPHG